MSAGRGPLRLAVLAVLSCSSGCVYHNVLYNAERLYADAERLRRSGQETLARDRYEDVIRKTSDAYRGRPQSGWAGEALFLLGRARLRMGALREANGALQEAEVRVGHERRDAVGAYLAVVSSEAGDQVTALARVNRALSGRLSGPALAEAHLLRGRMRLASGNADQGWWDLDRAAEAERAIRAEAGIERLRWAIHHGDGARTRMAFDRLLSYPEAGGRLPAVIALLAEATGRWGAAVAAELLAGADSSSWEREARGRIRLARAERLRESGAVERAADQAWAVAGGLGAAAAEARALLAHWYLEGARELSEMYAVRSILLPAGDDEQVAALVRAVDALEAFVGVGLDEPLGWFAAAEVARDELGADYVARGLFLAYADGAPGEPWAAKAILAALAVSRTEGDRAWLRGRLEAHGASPYVLAAHGEPTDGFEALEEELRVRLVEIGGR
jgi:hypothetical protein